jgi:hypothetical protein
MKDKDAEKWTEEVLNSMRGSETVGPSRDLFMDVQSQIENTTVRMMSLSQRIMAIAAAIILLAVNIFVMNSYGFFENNSTMIISEEASEHVELMSDFKIYE